MMLEFIPVILLVITLLYYLFGQRHQRLFPGPGGVPLFGVTFEVDKYRLHLSLYEWSKKYGDIFQFSVFGKSYVSLNSPEVIREVMGQEPSATVTSSRENTFFGNYIVGEDTDIVFASYSKEWAKRRKIASQIMQIYGEGMYSMEKETHILKDTKQYIGENQGRDIDPVFMVESHLLKDLTSLVSGTTDEDLRRHVKEMDDNSNKIALPLFDLTFQMFPFLRFLPFPITKKPFLVIQSIDRMMDSIKKLTTENNIESGIYCELKNAAEKYGCNITDAEVKGIIVNLIGAGSLTLRGTFMSLVHLMAEHPDIQRRIQEETDLVFGGKEVNVKDRKECPFSQAVLLETMRFVTNLPLGGPHFTHDDCIIRGKLVKKGTRILMNLWTINHSDDWGDPFNFRPERFLDESGSLLPATHPTRRRLMPFGYGKRSCLGELFGKNRAFLFLVNLMQTCTISKPTGETLPKFDPRTMMPGVNLQPQPYKVQFKLRKYVS